MGTFGMITSVTIEDEGNLLVCQSETGKPMRFHAMWLRDNAHDEATRSSQNGQRLITLADIPSDITIRSADLHGSRILIRFTDRDQEIGYDGDWLTRHCYDRADPRPDLWIAEESETWDHRLGNSMPTADFTELHDNEDTLLDWLEGLNRHGVAKVTGGPVKSGALLDVAALFGYVRETNYGKWFEVRTEVNPVNLAYTGLGLQGHTDNPYRDPTPTMQILYCLENSAEGGDSIVVDGFRCAETLHHEDPEGFDLLRRYCARFSYEGASGVALHSRRPMLECTPDGELIAVRFNNRSAAAFTDIPFDDMDGFYRAYRRFGELVEDPAMQVSFKLEPGESFVLDNTRVLHARTGYSGDGTRWLQGCYPDRDGMKSTLAAMTSARAAS